jgi:protein-L-isoaspartate(D-aspartate) O-methyltransferase
MLDESVRTADLRAFYARYVAARAAVKHPGIEEAFAKVPREPFAGPAPWSVRVFRHPGATTHGPVYIQTPGGDPAFLYQDTLIALDPARGINIGEPSLHARCLDVCAPRPGETVVQVGAGSGYYTAILACLVGQGGQVHAFEIETDLAERAKKNLKPWPWANVHVRSGATEGLPLADIIYVNAGIAYPAQAWLAALRPGGRLIFPLQSSRGAGGMLLIERPDQSEMVWPARFVSRASFITCQAQQDKGYEQALELAFAKEGWDEVRSIHLGDKPDETCWFDGGNWWLSTAPI